MRNLLNTFIVTIFFANYLFSQENTNVDTNYFLPKIGSSNLKVTSFRDGTNLNYVKNPNNGEFFSSNKPSYTIINVNGIDEYFYNWSAITHEKILAPKGLKIPSPSDFINLRNNNLQIKLRQQNDNSNQQKLINQNIFILDTVGIVENDYVGTTYNRQFYWVTSGEIDEYKSACLFEYDPELKKYNLGIYSQYRDNGLPVRCIEDLSESIKTKTYDFRLLMPNKFKNFNQKILSIIPFPKNNTSNNSVNILAKIEFDRSGSNKSELLSLHTKSFNFKNDDLIKNNIQNTFNYYLQTPVYQNQFVSSFSDLNYSITYENLSKTYTSSSNSFAHISKIEIIEKEFNKIKGTADFDVTNLLNKNISIKVFVEKQTKILSSNNTKVDSVNRFVLTKVKPMGSPFLAIVPGMGTGTVTNFSENHKGAIKFLLFTSIPVGLISLGSYIYSSANYNKYKASADFPSDLYNKANRAHKVFLTTASLYTLLSVIDFSISMNIKSKSRKLGRKINNTIDDKFNGAVELSNLIW